jgi:hypothetical protein
MLDTLVETPISLTEAANLLPRRRAGKKASPATIFRWASNGIRGIKLEVIKVGGTLCTSRERLQKFYEKLTLEAAGELVPPPVTSRSRRASVKRAERVLDKAGV